MSLGAMQECLTEFYGLEIDYDVNDFLITDRMLAAALGGATRPVEEQLLISESEGQAEVSLYLRHELLERLRRNDPAAALTSRNIADFWTAFEGVSHFTYFVFKAHSDQCVTLLEMELQAEVDKYVATSLYLQRQGERVPSGLHRWLFDLPQIDRNVTAIEHDRYRHANRYAAKYCERLAPLLGNRRTADTVRRELRYFYRLPSPEKIGHIDLQH